MGVYFFIAALLYKMIVICHALPYFIALYNPSQYEDYFIFITSLKTYWDNLSEGSEADLFKYLKIFHCTVLRRVDQVYGLLQVSVGTQTNTCMDGVWKPYRNTNCHYCLKTKTSHNYSQIYKKSIEALHVVGLLDSGLISWIITCIRLIWTNFSFHFIFFYFNKCF